ILDWDVHHGNGTEQAFYDDPNIAFVSIHQHLSFPNNTGYKEDVGTGAGEGYNINIPLPPGTGDAGYVAAFQHIIAPILDEFEPELILISAGQDPGMFDPLGRMMMTAEGFGKLTDIMLDLANKHCDGKIVFCHEGGYSNGYVPFCTLRIVEQLSGIKTDVTDPFEEGSQGYPDQDPGMFDPLGRMMMTAEGFGKLTDIMLDLANKHCDGKIVFCHEGGYSNGYVPFCTLRIVEQLSGIKTDVTDPFEEGSQGYPD